MEKNLGMNKMNHFSKVMFSTYQYSHTYELEYISYVMIMAYELAYSCYVMNLTCRTLGFIIHASYMSKI